MTLTIEEYTTLLNIPDVEVDKIYTNSTRPKGYSTKIMMITWADKDWERIISRKQQRHIMDNFEVFNLGQQGTKQRRNTFALAICGLVIFPKDIWYGEAPSFDEVVELEESYQDLEAQFNIASALLDMDGRELDDPLRHLGDWTQNQEKSLEKNRACTKKATIHILVLAQ
ncbi:hypothetical protein V6N13_046287 [Hibiscus sabdariffa]|uniref:Uncharacterized protein n=1 Tax=Hibiscus sabdariffa TaxID=183260 RepID=A0ABR2A0B0_9ROSI